VPRLGGESLWTRFRRRVARVAKRMGDFAPDLLGVGGDSILVALLVIVVSLLLVFVGIPVLIAILDLAIVLLVATVGIVARLLFRRPWIIEAVSDDGTTRAWRVVGWRASSRMLTDIEQGLRIGLGPPAADD
jgi:hypothetical protein